MKKDEKEKKNPKPEPEKKRDDNDNRLGPNIAMGDMLGTGIPGGIDMDVTTLL